MHLPPFHFRHAIFFHRRPPACSSLPSSFSSSYFPLSGAPLAVTCDGTCRLHPSPCGHLLDLPFIAPRATFAISHPLHLSLPTFSSPPRRCLPFSTFRHSLGPLVVPDPLMPFSFSFSLSFALGYFLCCRNPISPSSCPLTLFVAISLSAPLLLVLTPTVQSWSSTPSPPSYLPLLNSNIESAMEARPD
jgi:hypothetical protein